MKEPNRPLSVQEFREQFGGKVKFTGRKMPGHSKDPKPSKGKEYIGKNLWAWCRVNSLEYVTEHEFAAPDRKWRFDWAIPTLKIGIEYEGLMSEKSRHTTAAGFTGDTEKYNAAQALGWKVLRFAALNYKDLIKELNRFL